MSHTLHSLARTTPKTQAEIRALRESGVSQRELMRHYSVSKATIVKWQGREDVENRSHRAHTLHTPPFHRAGVDRRRIAPPAGVAPG
ncbi:MAG: hypothetical protein LBP86_01940 [Azoarcus sp.]|nr:hypothetical protein [Azoarcus sp.]